MRAKHLLLIPFLCLPSLVQADPVDDLVDALGVPAIVEIMRAEGLAHGGELAQDMLPGGDGPGWSATVSRIYDAAQMEETVRQAFQDNFADVDVTALLTFFTDGPGAELVQLEISARQAMTDPDVEEAAREAWRLAKADDDPRLAPLEDFAGANDLIEANVTGALNASVQFYMGLVEGGAFAMGESDILTEVWQQEEETRTDTTEWVYAFLMMAYGPAGDAAVEAYTDLSKTPAGRVMNTALFVGFNEMYNDISYELGLAVAREMQSQDL